MSNINDEIDDFDEDLDDDINQSKSSNKYFIAIAVAMIALFMFGLIAVIYLAVNPGNKVNNVPWISDQAVELPPNVTKWMPGTASGIYYCERDGQWYQCKPKFP